MRPFLDAFRRGLAETGHVEGQNVAIEHRMARRTIGSIASTGGRSGPPSGECDRHLGEHGCARGKSRDPVCRIPIVFSVPEDPVKLGLVASLARPGGNATGINFLSARCSQSAWASCASWCPRLFNLRC